MSVSAFRGQLHLFLALLLIIGSTAAAAQGSGRALQAVVKSGTWERTVVVEQAGINAAQTLLTNIINAVKKNTAARARPGGHVVAAIPDSKKVKLEAEALKKTIGVLTPEIAPGGEYRRRLQNAVLIGKPVDKTASAWAESFSKLLVMPGTVMTMQSPGVVPATFDAPENRTKLCKDAFRSKTMSNATRTCICDAKRPWPECNALMFEEGKVVYEEAFAAANLTASGKAGRRLLEGLTVRFSDQEWELEEGLKMLAESVGAPGNPAGSRSLLAAKKKKKTKCSFPELLGVFDDRCAEVACSIPIPPYLKFKLGFSGCLPVVSLASNTLEMCGSNVVEQSKCTKLSEATYAAAQSATTFADDSRVDVKAEVCMNLKTFDKILSWVGLDGICSGPTLSWYPAKSQLGYSFGQSLIIAGLTTSGRIQYDDSANNTICNFFRSNKGAWNWQMKCQDFCAWDSASGMIEQSFTLNLLFWAETWTWNLIKSDVPSCDPAPLPCSPGQYTRTQHKKDPECRSCPRGTWSNVTRTYQCYNCDTGSYNPTKGLSTPDACQPCPLGTFQNQTAADSASKCFNCTMGTYNPFIGMGNCMPCELGTYGYAVGAQTKIEGCKNAPPGSFVNVTGVTNYTLCHKGYYQPLEGQANCTACLPGTYSSVVGATSSSTCTLCPGGQYNELPGQSQCTLCPSGTYLKGTGSSSASDCLKCPSRGISSPGSTKCTFPKGR